MILPLVRNETQDSGFNQQPERQTTEKTKQAQITRNLLAICAPLQTTTIIIIIISPMEERKSKTKIKTRGKQKQALDQTLLDFKVES